MFFIGQAGGVATFLGGLAVGTLLVYAVSAGLKARRGGGSGGGGEGAGGGAGDGKSYPLVEYGSGIG